MLTLDVKGNHGDYKVNLPTSLDEISQSYISEVTSHVRLDANYSLIGLVFKDKLSSLLLASRKKTKQSDVAVIPVFVKAGKTDSEFINSLTIKEKLIIAPSDIMMGYHVSTPKNIITINNILNIIDGDMTLYNKLLTIKDECYFIEFKIVPNCNIHGAYNQSNNDTFDNPFITKIGEPKSNIITSTPSIII